MRVTEHLSEQEKTRNVLGWIGDYDTHWWPFSDDPQKVCYFSKTAGRGVLATGTDEWADYTIAAKVKVHCPGFAGLLARYQGLQRYYAFVWAGDKLQLLRVDAGDSVLAEAPCTWQADEYHRMTLTVSGATITAVADDGVVLLHAEDDRFRHGGAGFVFDKSMIGFREVVIGG